MSIEKGMYEFWEYDLYFFEEYCIYNEYGDLIGVKDDAPNDFKKAFEEYMEQEKKYQAESLAEGYLIS